MKHILPTLLLLSVTAQLLADDTLIYNQTVSVDTIFSHYDNVEIIAHNTITLDAGFTFSSNGNGSFTANADPWNIELPTPDVVYGDGQDSTGSQDGSYIVGSIKGQAGVSPTGAGTYSIPLEVPPGIKNMVPQLAITYNSQAGNGILGRGWNISGLSSIVATGKTRYYDNESTVISTEDTACRLNWDGQRLLALNSAGLDADSFRTEMVTNVKITKESDSGDEWFEIKTQNGRTLEYGRSTDSRMSLDSNTPWKWMLNKVSDRNGNTIQYSYTTDSDTKRILLSKVKYGGLSVIPLNEIEFNYISRDDISYGYIHDDLIVSDKLLDNIILTSNFNKNYGKYQFVYDTTGNETLLEEIIQYDKDNYRYNATSFEWESPTFDITSTATSQSILSGDDYQQFSGDFTGDGIFDIVSVKIDAATHTYKYYLYEGSTSGLSTTFTESGDLPRSYAHEYWSNIVSLYNSKPCGETINSTFDLKDISYVFSGDFDGDGIEELYVKVIEWDDLVQYLPDDLNSTFTYTDVFSNGLTDDVCLYEDFIENPLYADLTTGIGRIVNLDESGTNDYSMQSFLLGDSYAYEKQVYQFPDLEGFGQNCIPEKDSLYYYHPDKNTMEAYIDIPDNSLIWGEYNGDGKTDYISYDNSKWKVKTYRQSTNSFTWSDTIYGDFLGMIDLNGDGISAWVTLEEYIETFTVDDLWDDSCSTCDYTVDTDWNNFLDRFNLTTDFDNYDNLNCNGISNDVCRYSYLMTATTDLSLGYQLYADHLNGRGPKVNLGLFAGIHSQEYPMFTRAIAMDIDADQKNDLLVLNDDTLRKIYYNFEPAYNSSTKTISYDYSLATKNTFLSDTMQLGDFNGDGIFEMVFPDVDSSLSFVTAGKPGKLINSVTNGMGVESRYSYKPLTNSNVYTKESDASYPVMDFSAPWYVVNSISSDNGVADSSFVEYEYEGAKVHLQGKGFLGFMKTSVENDLLNTSQISVSDYDTIFYATYPVSTTQKAGTQNLQSSTSSTRVDSIAPYKYKMETDTVAVQDVLKDITNTITYKYNTNDGLISEKKSDVDGEATITEKYAYTNAGWHVDYRPVSMVRKYERDGSLESDSTIYTYNSSNGNLTKKKDFCGTDRELTTTYRNYDSYGNPKTTATSGKMGQSLSIDSVETTLKYLSYGRFLMSKSGPLNLLETFDVDEGTGVLESKTGANRKETFYEYGPFNRLKKTIHPDRIEEATTLYWTGDDTDDKPTGALYHKWTSISSSPPVKSFYDAMGRELRTVTVGFDDESIYVDTEYDSKGRVKRKSNPYFSTGTAYWNRTTYDSYGRTDSIISADTTITTYSYTNLTTTVTTKKGSTTTTTKQTVNALGETEESEDNMNNKVYHSYYPDGKLKESHVSTHASDSTKFSYDAQGNRTTIDDPDAGTITSLYDAFGQLLRQINANDDTTTYQYDKLGRMTQLSDARGDVKYGYVTDTTSAAFGLIDSVYLADNSIQDIFEYDSDYGRLTSETKSFLNKSLENAYTYDWFGRPSTRTYPSDFEIQYAYTSNGDLDQVTGNGLTLWSCSNVNALGQIYSYSQGSNSTSVTYNIHGELNQVETGSIMDMQYSFDDRGNLLHRIDNDTDQKEVFTYDNLNRLTGIEYSDNGTHQTAYDVTMVYDNCGNITSKTGLSSSIKYGEGTGTGPHALTSMDNPDTAYYPPPQAITYNQFNKVSSISDTLSGGVPLILDFTYGLSNQRIKTVQTRNSTIERVKYFDVDYEEDSTSSGLKKYHYIYGGTGLTAIFVMEGSGNDTMHYVLSDHLGSLTGIVNATTSAVTKYSFNAWGIPRDASDWTKPDSSYLFAGRGYTGHEHLTDFNLINMNGRVYDPILGRFLSPDPYVQMPDYPNNFNRYAYALNNPLIYTDPDGEFIHIIIGGVIGGAINLGIKAFQGKIHSFKDGFVAFGIGAAAGAIGAATGGGAFLAAGGGAAGAGGFLAGAAGGMMGSAFASPIQSMGNTLYFGDPLMTGKQYLMGIAMGGLFGGAINGGIALNNGRTFWSGNLKSISTGENYVPSLRFDEPDFEVKPSPLKLRDGSSLEDHTFSLRTTESIEYTIEGRSLPSLSRPDINGYGPSATTKPDLYHNFPREFDRMIVKKGAWSFRLDDYVDHKNIGHLFEAPGMIDGKNGLYQIGINDKGIIFHRFFKPYN